MKRIPSKISLGNVTAGIVGTQKIRIVDFENSYDLCMEQNGEVVFEGKEIDFIGWQYSKYYESEYHGMRLDGDTIVFKIFTKYEAYK